MKANTSKERNFYTQGQQFIARVLFTVWLLASVSPEGTLAIPKRQMVPATTTSPGDPSLASAPPTPPPGGILQLPPDSPGAFWSSGVARTPSLERALQQRMSQEATPDQEHDLLRTSPKVFPVEEHWTFQAREGESVRFHYQKGQWHAEVSSHMGPFSRQSVLPVVCSQGEDIASSLEVLSRYPSWQRQRQIHVLDRNVCPTLGAVVYVGELGLKGGGGGEALGSGEQEESDPPLVKELRALASDPQIDQQPDKLAELGGVLLKLAKAKQEEKRGSVEDLSPYTDAAILYQHVLSICEQKADTLGSPEASTLADKAYQGLAQIQASMLARAKGAAPITVEEVQARISADKQRLEAIRTKAREEAERLAAFRDKQGSAEEVRGAETVYIEGSKKLFADIAKEIKSVLGNFYQEGEEELKVAGIACPCKYAIMGVGSIALQQTTPYSDLEFAILMEDAPDEDEDTAEEWRKYFRKLTHLVHFRVINLGETVLPFSEYKISLDHLGRKGLNFDLGGKTPLGRKDKDYELIQPVEGMMEYLKNKDNKMEQMDKLLPFVLERTCYIYGDQGLHNDYLASQKAFWSSCQDEAGKHAYQERMRKVLLEGITELDHSQPGVVKAGRKQAGNLRTVGPKLHPEDAGRLYDVKQEIYRLPDRLLYGLATYYGLRPESAWDAVEQLKAQGIIGVSEEAKQAAHRLKYAVSFATMLRLATYIRYGQQKETLSGSASNEQTVSELFALPKEALQENGSLFKYYYTALALHREMNGFFKMLHLRSQIQPDRDLHRMLSVFSPGGKYAASKEKAYFCSSGFYDTSCAAKLAIYNRLLHYEQAAKCAEDHLEEVKRGYNHKKIARYHHNLGVSYYHRSRFDQSFDHFKTSLELLEGLYPDGDPQVAAVLRSLGIAHYNLSEFQESLEYFKRSLEMLQRLYQENNPETAQALGSVGAAYGQLESFQESLDYKQQALKMFQALYPDKDPEKARALLSLGDTYAAMGQLAAIRDQKEDALAEFQQSLQHKQSALEMFRALYGKSHPEVARALLSLGESYALDGKLAASLEHKQKALRMLQALYGSSHPEVARALLSVGESYEAMDQLAESKEYKNKSVAMFEIFYEDTHSEVSQALKSLSRTKSAHISALKERNPVHTSVPSLRPVRIAHPQPLALLPTPRHGKEPAGENTLLRSYYKDDTFACISSLFDEQRSGHVKDLQCQLMLREKKLVKEDKDKEQAEGSSKENQVASRHARLEEVKTPIDLQDLFRDRSVHPDKPVEAVQRILLTGDPGTGKTTVSRKLAYQWAVGKWGPEVDNLYLLPVRKLQQSEYDGTRYNREKTLATAIVNICFANDLPTTEADYNRLREHIEQELEKSTTLVILDGLDERTGASEQILSQAQDQSAPHKLLMLSRPYGIETERRLANIEIDHRGFNAEQLKAYVREELREHDDLAKELLGYIHKHENIRSIAHIPVNLQILCALWKDQGYGVREELKQGSLPGLYRLFAEFTWQRYAQKCTLADEDEEELFDTLGQIALAALKQGEVLISPGLVHQYARKGKLKDRLKDAGFLLLQYVGDASFKRSSCYQFPHLTFQEYLAGRTLASQFLSANPRAQQRANTFLSRHKYAPQYASTLSFMAGEVSQAEGVEGIQALLKRLEEDKEVVGVQHLLLQLRVLHEWLCMAQEEVEEDMAMLEGEFKVKANLRDWFVRAFTHMRQEEDKWDSDTSVGYKLLDLLTHSLQFFRAVASHTPELFELLKKAAEDKSERVCAAAALGALPSLVQSSSDRAQEAFRIILAAFKDKYEDERVRKAALGALSSLVQSSSDRGQEAFRIILSAFKDKYEEERIRKAALGALSSLVQTAPGRAQEAFESIRAALEDQAEEERIRKAALGALSSLVQTAPGRAQEAFESIRATLKDKAEEERIRKAAPGALSSLAQSSPELTHEAFGIILATLKDQAEDKRVRAAALGSLPSLAQSSSDRGQEAFGIILAAFEDKDEDERVRKAALGAFPSLVQSSSDRGQKAFGIILATFENKDWDVRVAALESLSSLVQASPDRAQEAFGIIRKALKDKYKDLRGRCPVRAATLESLSSLAQSFPDRAQEAFESIRTALEDKEDWSVRAAALELLSSLAQSSPDRAQEAFKIILAALKDQAEDERVRAAALGALSSLAQSSSDRAQEAFESILEALDEVDEVGTVHKAALAALEKAPLERLLESYWARPGARLIPYITTLLYHTPLVVSKVPGQDQQQVILYATAGKPDKGTYAEEAVQRFAQLIEKELH